MSKLLEIKNLKLVFNSYLGVVDVLNNISFSIENNSWLGLVGESGSGKTVTAFAIMKLLPESAKVKEGKIFYKNENILEKSEKEMNLIRGKEISMVFQEPQTALNPSMRIGENIIEMIRVHDKRISRKTAKKMAIDLLDKVKINSPLLRFKQYPHELSGGMQQRVCIALALSCNPSLLIADEFTTSLDVTIEKEILDLVLKMQVYMGMSVLFITHDLALIYNSCEYVVVIYAGQIVEKGKVDEVFKYPAHPYTKLLLDSIPTIADEKKRLASIEGSVPSLINPPRGCRFNPRCKCKIKGLCDTSFPDIYNINNNHQVWCHLFK